MSFSPLYVACRNGDIDAVQQLLPTLSLDEIIQDEPNGSTSLHASCSFDHPQIVKLLLDHGFIRSVSDNQGCTALDVAASEQIKNLFRRSFSAAQAHFVADDPEETSEWTSVKYGDYGWWNKCHMLNNDVVKAADSLLEDERFRDASSMRKIEYFLRKARQTKDPKWLAQAYSAETGFSRAINEALAKTPSMWKDESTADKLYLFVAAFFHTDAMKRYRYCGRCYRGMKLSYKDFETKYRVGQTLLTKPFISTSKCREIAERFAVAPSVGSRPLSILCIYTIPEYTLQFKDNVALDISSISEYPHEEEVLILPYTSLEIQNITHLPSGVIEVELKWYSFTQTRS